MIVMKLNTLGIILFSLFCGTIANAQIVQKLHLKNGSVLEGYIAKQKPGENLEFKSERATIYMSGSKVRSYSERQVKVSELDEKWAKWAEENDAYIGVNENRTFTFNDIITENGTISGVRVLEKGAKVKYIDMSPREHILNWDTIAVLSVDKRPKTLLTGIDRIYKLKDGTERKGQYVEEVPGKTLSLYTIDGVVEVCQTKDVMKYIMKGIHPTQSILEQSPLLDVVDVKNASIVRGVIIEQNYGINPNDDYLLIQREDGGTQSIKVKDVQEFQKEENKKYAPKYDILLNENELVVNRMQTNSLEVKEEGSIIILPSDSCLAVVEKKSPETDVIIETRLGNASQNPSLDIVKVSKWEKGKGRKKNTYWGFSYEDIVKKNINPIKVETSVNATTRFEYKVKEEGLYVIYFSKEKKVIPFRIK